MAASGLVLALPVITHRVPATGGVELAVDTWTGDGVGMLLVHGLASNARLWDGMAACLGKLGHAVATVDQRGHGRSDKPDWGYDFATVCNDLSAVIQALRGGLGGDGRPWKRPVVVGQSWGANVVLELAWRQPEAMAGAACVDGGIGDLAERFVTWESCRQILAPPRFAGTPAEAFETMVRRSHPTWPESGLRGALANVEVRPDGTVAPWLSFEHHLMILQELYGHRPSTRYAGLQVPLLLVPADTGDTSWTDAKRASVEAALAVAPVARAQWFSPADHDIQAQFPGQLADILHAAVTQGFFS